MDLWPRCDVVRPYSVEQATMEDISQQVEGVVLAAGLSSRSGQYKMALPWGDKTLIEKSIEGIYELASRILVVIGWRAEQIRSLLAAYHKVELVPNDDFRAGMFSSVKVGITHIRAPRFFLLPGDHPLIGAEVYTQMLAVTEDIVIPTFGGRRGHPVLFNSHLIPEILHSSDNATLRDYIRMKGHIEVEVEQESILIDIDTLEDYHAVLSKYESKGERLRRVHKGE
jgi:molybdenum cofactor cytidylyltransferase